MATSAAQSPTARRTRRTRSRSVELGNDTDSKMNKTRNTRRSPHEASVESIESNMSAGSRVRSGGRVTRAAARNLPVVTEGRETPELQEDEDEDEDAEELLYRQGSSRSPGAMSQRSQRSDTTANTSHSVQEISDMNIIRIIEYLPDLWRTSYELLMLLTPRQATKEAVLKIVRDLQIPGSPTSDLLRMREQMFKHPRDAYGSDQYIRSSYVLRKLFNKPDPGYGNFRPDAILQAANLARMIKDLLATPRDTQNAFLLMQALDTAFPSAFMTDFDTKSEYGKSTMIEEAFEIGLQIRIQAAILYLMSYRGAPAYNPEELLVDVFYQPLNRHDKSSSILDDALKNGQLKDVAGMLEGRVPPAKRIVLKQRVKTSIVLIHKQFGQSDVDFDDFDELFPWSLFLTETVKWARSRLGEIEQSIKAQGGVQSIRRSLADSVHQINPEINLIYDQPTPAAEPRQLLPAANIIPASTSNSRSLLSFANLQKMQEMKAQKTGAAPPNRNQRTFQRNEGRQSDPRTPVNLLDAPAHRASEPTRGNKSDDNVPGRNPNRRSAAEYDAVWEASINERNKENRPIVEQERTKRHWIDPQPGRTRVQFDDESQLVVVDDGDDDFQTDARPPNPAKTRKRMVSQTASPGLAQQMSKRQKTVQRSHDEDEDEDSSREVSVRRRRQTVESPDLDALLQASAREPDNDAESRRPRRDPQERPFSLVNELARLKTVQSKTSGPKKRTMWSDDDTDLLIDLIGEYGCSWSLLEAMGKGKFEMERGQVALKDKARNIKVSYLKSRYPLPKNFDKVPLGAKEKAAVKAVNPDWTSDEGE
ncbi:hypothetical protein F5884DRAFT_802816 [Xylogone sp. PMI_703]|nr:hypothetical protein F5884DRAFT_802816 [Xylogone sp. PMI_703]